MVTLLLRHTICPLIFDDLFMNPSGGDLTFTSTLTAELGDVDVQDFVGLYKYARLQSYGKYDA